jgi:hypothetical protein
MILNEAQQKWSSMITETLGITDQKKLSWMSQYAANHEVFEGQQSHTANVSANGIFATPLNTMGMGNPQMPSNAGLPGGKFGEQVPGSGDIPMSTLTMALEIAAVTIGLELVPVIPSSGPWAMLSYMDFPYAGGKYDRIGNLTDIDGKGPDAENKPIYVKVAALFSDEDDWKEVKAITPLSKDVVVSGADGPALRGAFVGISRIDNAVIIKVKGVAASAADAKAATPTYTTASSIADVMKAATVLEIGAAEGAFAADYTSDTWTASTLKADLVATAADHVQGFANFATGDADPMSRAENETGTGNTIGARMYTKLVQMGAYEVTGTVTRQQLQDMPLYGVDVIGKVLEAMQNEISQHINNRILDRVFRLGVDNAATQYRYQGVDLNLYLNDVDGNGLKLNKFDAWSKYVGLNGADDPNRVFLGAHEVPNAIQNTAAENVTTHQRRIMSRLLAGANLIANVSRRGRGQWAVTNTQILSALQDASGFVIAPMVNTLVQDGSNSLYFAGSIAGLNLYVDPYMTWDDTRVCIGRKSNGNDPGVIFMPYILADTVQTIVEGTMAPKLLVNSRFAIVDAGFHPEQNYYTFMVQTSDKGSFLI